MVDEKKLLDEKELEELLNDSILLKLDLTDQNKADETIIEEESQKDIIVESSEELDLQFDMPMALEKAPTETKISKVKNELKQYMNRETRSTVKEINSIANKIKSSKKSSENGMLVERQKQQKLKHKDGFSILEFYQKRERVRIKANHNSTQNFNRRMQKSVNKKWHFEL